MDQRVLTEMIGSDRNVQIAIAAASIVQATAADDGMAIGAALKMFDQAYDHIMSRTRVDPL